MKFHRYLEQLFGSRVSISLIRALSTYKGKIFTIRGLAKVASVSPSEAAVVVQQLEKFSIITLQPVGRSYQVLLNGKSYVLNKIMRQIIIAEEKTFDELVSVLKRILSSENIISASVFGSLPRGEEKEDSDIDLLVISNNFDQASALVAKAQEEVSLIFGNRISPIILSETDLAAKKNDRLIRSVINSHISIKGKHLKELLEEK